MASRLTLKLWLRQWLGTASDDPAFADALLDPSLQAAYDGLIADLKEISPGFLVATAVTLVADTVTSHRYTFATQSVPITDFAKWLQVRYLTEDGSLLSECRVDELSEAPAGYFALSGPDDTAVLVTSPDTAVNTALWFQYTAWPAAFTADASVPSAIPSRFHDVVALECLFVYGNGGEQRMPPELRERWQTRRAQLLSAVSRRGVGVGRTRLVENAL
jgi:hypothetical protein